LRYKNYFESIAKSRIVDRKRHSYYWNDITKYIEYFSHPDISVLEIGCGTGELLSGIKAQSKTGVDFSEKMIAIAKSSHPEITFHVMAAEELMYVTGTTSSTPRLASSRQQVSS